MMVLRERDMMTEKQTDQAPMAKSTITVGWGDGSSNEYTPEQFQQLLLEQARITECVVSIEEGRPRREYEGAKRFVSAKVSFARDWDIIDAVSDPAMMQLARVIQGQIMHHKVMQMEHWLFSMVAHAMAKDRLPPYWRDPTNPFVENPTDLQAALQAASGRPSGTQGTSFHGGPLPKR